MREISNLEIHCLARELQPLVGARLQKFYELGDGEFRVELHSKGKGTRSLESHPISKKRPQTGPDQGG